jgi:uncharacterized membrane protein
MMDPGGFGWMVGFGGRGMLLSVLVWLAVSVLVVWAITSVFNRTPEATGGDALEKLKRRYAAGEITQAEFETARRALAA